MGVLTHKDFTAFFRALWGFDPFPWQQDLLQRLATGKDPRRDYEADRGFWPDVLDLPTGSGKTATLDIAVFHLALEALEKHKRCARVRIAFIVDRRLIVDDAYERAKRIAQALHWSLLSEEAAKSAESQEQTSSIGRDFRTRRVRLPLDDLEGSGEPCRRLCLAWSSEFGKRSMGACVSRRHTSSSRAPNRSRKVHELHAGRPPWAG
jgi:CRISPR-associated endonuclease/helicase Cas3